MAYDTSAEKKILFAIIDDLHARQAGMTDNEKWADSVAVSNVTGDLSAAIRNYLTRGMASGRGSGRS